MNQNGRVGHNFQDIYVYVGRGGSYPVRAKCRRSIVWSAHIIYVRARALSGSALLYVISKTFKRLKGHVYLKT